MSGVRVKPHNEDFEVCIDIESDKNGKRYYIYKQQGNKALWLTKNLELHHLKGYRGFVREWEKVAKIVSRISAGEIK